MLPESKNDPNKSETLWDVYQSDTKPSSPLDQEAGTVANISGALLANSPDWLWNTIMWSVGAFCLGAMVMFGGRDLLLLTGRAEVKASLIARGTPWNCSSRHNLNRMCQTLTYSYNVDGNTYQASITVTQGDERPVIIKYVSWAPSVYKLVQTY